MKTIKILFALILFANMLLLGACSDVEGMGTPQPLQSKVEVESADYYVQITQENIDGLAFVYRWMNIGAAKYAITITVDGEEELIDVPDKSILTYNNVRELSFSNKELMDWLDTFGLLTSGGEALLSISLNAYNADGTPISPEEEKNSKISVIHVTIAPDIDINTPN